MSFGHVDISNIQSLFVLYRIIQIYTNWQDCLRDRYLTSSALNASEAVFHVVFEISPKKDLILFQIYNKRHEIITRVACYRKISITHTVRALGCNSGAVSFGNSVR